MSKPSPHYKRSPQTLTGQSISIHIYYLQLNKKGWRKVVIVAVLDRDKKAASKIRLRYALNQTEEIPT